MIKTISTALIIFIVSGLFSQNNLEKLDTKFADSLFLAKDYRQAAKTYKILFLKSNPQVLSLYRMAFSSHQINEQSQAILLYNSVINHNTNTSLTRLSHIGLSKIYSTLSLVDSSFAHLNRAISYGYSNLSDLEHSPEFNNLRLHKNYSSIHDQIQKSAFPCMYKEENKWFDYWVGEWNAYVTGTTNLAGISKIEKISGDCAVLENWTSINNAFNGKSINFYNTDTKKWEQHWIGSAGGYLKFENGEYKDSAMRFTFTRKNQDGTVSIGKFTFFNQGPDQVRQLSESSKDNGTTWISDYDFTYFRKKSN